MNMLTQEFDAACDDRSCIAGEHLELIAILMLDIGVTDVYEYPVYRNEHNRNLCMVKLTDGSGKDADVSAGMLSGYGSLFFANQDAFPHKDEEPLGRQVPLAQPGQKTHLGCRFQEPLLWFLLDLGLDMVDIHNCRLRKDSREEYWVLRLDQLSNGEQRFGDLGARVDRLSSVFYAEPSECGPRDLIAMEDIIGDLSPDQVATGLPYSTLVFWCANADKFRSVLDTLFRLGIRQIHAAKLQERGEQVYLVRAVDIESPIVLSRFGYDTGVHIFYSLPSSADIWIEWGWEYALPDFSYYNIFSPEPGWTSFLFSNGTKAHVEQPDYNRLLRFLNLHIDPGSKLQLLPDSSQFEENEFQYRLRLTRGTWQNRGKQELEDLLREEKEIRDRIDWLREIDGIFEGYLSHRVLFYPFSRTRKDPAFPNHFFRQQSLSELRKLAYYYGNASKLGDGVMVCGKHFIAESDSGDYEIPDKVYPRDGMVFESCADWNKLVGLRVLRPRGLDLFPYLEVDQADHNKIRDALLDRVIARDADGVDVKISKAEEEEIRANPQRYLFFLYRAKDEENSELEGFVLHEDKFKEFDLKIANMGVFFAQTEEEREIATKSYADSVEQHYTSAFDESMVKLRDDLELTFQKERVTVKDEIERFNQDLSEKLKALAKKTEDMNKLVRSIKSNELQLNKYDRFLSSSLSKYEELTRDMPSELLEFTIDIERIISRVVSNYTKMVDEKFEKLDDEVAKLEGLRDFRARTTTGLEELTAKKKSYEQALSSLNSANEWLDAEQDLINKSSLEKEVKDLWVVNDAFKLVSDSLNKIEHHLDSTRFISDGHFSGFSEEQNRWAGQVASRASRVQVKLPDFLGDGKGKQAIIGHFEILSEALQVVEKWTQDSTNNHIDRKSLRGYQQEIDSLVRDSIQRLPRAKQNRSLLGRLFSRRL
ncbi:hypothetical protein MNBD_CHLOROFLEXI01-507 [hydrothermal vent metagenome]|uniref:Uncharacterized protein n=1 Tax=hydrothermal vent metagenome TaxID=652676 RepID=A0A3B0VT51_9ZZZZ